MNKEIGQRIAKIRRDLNLNKEQFGKLIGISGQYISSIETGYHGLSLDTLINLCERTNTSADYILFGIDLVTQDQLKNLFVGIDKSQIDTAFKVLEFIALFIKDQENKT